MSIARIEDLLSKVAEHERQQQNELEKHFNQIVKSMNLKKQDQQNEVTYDKR